MPHKRAKASVRVATSAAKGFDLPPTAADSLVSQNQDKKRKRADAKAKSDKKKNDAYGGLSKNVWRIVNAEKLREAHRERRKTMAEEGRDEHGEVHVGEKGGKGKRKAVDHGLDNEEGAPLKKREDLRIKPGEKLGDFNRRVEDEMRSEMTAVHKAARRSRKPHPAKQSPPQAPDPEDEAPTRVEDRAREFAPRPTSFSLHLTDVAMAPPSLRMPSRSRAQTTDGSEGGKGAKKAKKSDRLLISPAQKRMLEDEREKVVKRYREMKEQRVQRQQGSMKA